MSRVKGFRLYRAKPLLTGIAASIVAAASLFFFGADRLETQREQYFDAMTQWIPAPQSDAIVVVDIDRKAYQSIGDKDWARAQTAQLVAAIAKAKPRAIAFDFIFSAGCDAAAPDNLALAAAIKSAPTVLGFLVGEQRNRHPQPVPPLAIRKPVAIPELWFVDGAETSCPFLEGAAKSSAAAFLVGDEDARVRRVQAFTIIGNNAYPALGIEVARIGMGISAPVLGGEPAWLRLNAQVTDLDEDGSLRFAASTAEVIAARTVSAGDILKGTVPDSRLAGKLVLIGSSLPNLGGLRSSASMPLEPSVQIHADIANAILTNFIPERDARLTISEAGAALLGGLIVTVIATQFRPIVSAVLGLAAVGLIVGGTVLAYAQTALLFDAVGISIAVLFALVATSIMQFAYIRRAESTARQRFAQYLPQSVVARYIDNPDMARVAGEERQVTALFTDIEGFSTLSQKVGPRDLIAMLDIYFAEVTALVSKHGGMVDKIVGDAVHALFNAPEDLADHVNKAIDCAEAINRLAEEIEKRPLFAGNAFGRTRIGIETGTAVLGEVGAGGKLDYTAHGDAINLAARLQDANKFLGTTICIGPEAARLSGRALTPIGTHEIRGFGTMELFTTGAIAPAIKILS
ncbi:CHASE2 domain-containing protein [Pararhizobium sp.]|uniref:CHASE2 domain-containing protein n=1 Tax=Pararhizobium sp. TaxID=1977563 RepID=UPI0027168E6E|nr:adenylate/guanylate cyclase domain-containing protein [Pararhizobium sp.]MDO9416386.1 adenylate/guanylate cyclase domain-containing protein [Pararhizobium sp.]